MTRFRPPSSGANPALDLARHQLGQAGVATPRDLRRTLDEGSRASVSTPRVRPVVSGSRSDGTALASLLRILADAGQIDDQSSA